MVRVVLNNVIKLLILYCKGNSRYVFNIKGNRYRIVAVILFQIQIAYIRFIGTHGQYDRINCKEI
ncbi:MAG: type II toxin-antitoxin system HigB family toxin [Bacteroidales bacterium]